MNLERGGPNSRHSPTNFKITNLTRPHASTRLNFNQYHIQQSKVFYFLSWPTLWIKHLLFSLDNEDGKDGNGDNEQEYVPLSDIEAQVDSEQEDGAESEVEIVVNPSIRRSARPIRMKKTRKVQNLD